MSDLIDNNNRLSILSRGGGSLAATCGMAGAAAADCGAAAAAACGAGASVNKFSALDAGPRHWV